MILMTWDEWVRYRSTLRILRNWRDSETYIPKCRKLNDLIAKRITDDITVDKSSGIIEYMFSSYATEKHTKKELEDNYLYHKPRGW